MLISFEIKNVQEDYAKCLEFIRIYENDEISQGEKKRLLLKIVDNTSSFSVKVNLKFTNVAYNYLEQPITIKGKVIDPETKTAVKINELNIDKILHNKTHFLLHYHVRVHFSKEKDDIINLQYLAILLISLDGKGFFENKTNKRLTVFLVPFSENYYPFKKGNDLFKIASTYLRLMAKKYNGVIYGIDLNKDDSVVTAINFRQNIRYGLYLPLILIDHSNYFMLFSDSITREDLESLFGMKSRGRFGKSRDENPNVACKDFLLEALFYHLFDIIEKYFEKYDQWTEEKKGNSGVMNYPKSRTF